MDILFHDEKLQTICNDSKEAVKKLGTDQARVLRRRLDFMRAAANLSEIPHTKPFRRHELQGKWKGIFSIDVKHPYRILFKPANQPLPKKDDGGIDLKETTIVMILGIEDTHDKKKHKKRIYS